MATFVEKEGIEACIAKINSAIEQLLQAANNTDSAMNELPDYWQGAAYDKARGTYEQDYQKLLTTTVPEAVTGFKEYINQCKETIIEIDNQLAGR